MKCYDGSECVTGACTVPCVHVPIQTLEQENKELRAALADAREIVRARLAELAAAKSPIYVFAAGHVAQCLVDIDARCKSLQPFTSEER